jgi:hypothetical protein
MRLSERMFEGKLKLQLPGEGIVVPYGGLWLCLSCAFVKAEPSALGIEEAVKFKRELLYVLLFVLVTKDLLNVVGRLERSRRRLFERLVVVALLVAVLLGLL